MSEHGGNVTGKSWHPVGDEPEQRAAREYEDWADGRRKPGRYAERPAFCRHCLEQVDFRLRQGIGPGMWVRYEPGTKKEHKCKGEQP